MTYSEEDVINYRINRALETLNEAKDLTVNKHWNGTINRLYYACFYIILALMLKNKINSTTHSGVKTLFHQHFIKTKIISLDQGKLYNELFGMRHVGDYSDLKTFDETTVMALIPKPEIFIEKIKELL